MIMAKKQKPKIKKQAEEADSTFLLKLVLFLILGFQWVHIQSSTGGIPEWQIPIPVGLFIGLWFASKDHFQIDRKIEYTVLLIATFIAFWLPVGIFIEV